MTPKPIEALVIINQSTVVAAAEFQQVMRALQVQITRDFAPVWGPRPTLLTHGNHTWKVYLLDDSDQANALGYHETDAAGFPVGKVFAKTDIDNGLSWSVTLSHEILELLVDPFANLTVLVEDHAKAYAAEVCDACEADGDGYLIDSVRVSDFVYPAWFGSPGARMDFQGKIQQPFQLLPGGYIGYYDLKTRHWKQDVHADHIPRSNRRFERRAK